MSTILTIHSKLHPLKENVAVNTNKPTICSEVLKKSIKEKNSILLVKLNFIYALRQNYLYPIFQWRLVSYDKMIGKNPSWIRFTLLCLLWPWNIQTKLMNNNNMRRFGKSMQGGNHWWCMQFLSCFFAYFIKIIIKI